ncbi:MAG: hypothetical protein AAF681_15390 [Pseudomonadota bacterium]
MPVSDEELARTRHYDRGQKLARRDAWEDLSEAMRAADHARRTTLGGEPTALLLAEGARSDVVAAAEDALYDLMTPNPDWLTDLASVLRDYPSDYPTATIVALAHLDIARAWQRLADLRDPKETAEHVASLISKASDILEPFRSMAHLTPCLGAAMADLAFAKRQPAQRITELYEDLIALEPGAHRHMRTFGRQLLFAPGGGPTAIEVAARRMAVQLEERWGSGGYVWVYMDALAINPVTLDLIDPELFIEGLRDILARTENLHTTNLLAAFCAITMRPRSDLPTAPHAAKARSQIHDFVDHILRFHLSELHPLIWSQAILAPRLPRRLPARRALASKGRQTALRVIAARLAEDIVAHGEITLAGGKPTGRFTLRG